MCGSSDCVSHSGKKVSEAELGRRTGMSRQSVNKILNGQTDPSISRVLAIVEALEMRLNDLFPDYCVN